jgi:ATP/maltotriose-dependent transcriptional regulator MalT
VLFVANNNVKGGASFSTTLREKRILWIYYTLYCSVFMLSRQTLAASSFDEKHRFLNSVVSVLEGEPELAQSSALARALVSRAQARYEDQHTEEALGDALRATSMKSTSWNALSWRMVADCYKTLGKPDEAIAALREWGSCEPAFRSKVNREIQELRRLL